ncbi:KN57gp_099 [Dikerogammarus haemobaphes nudivirus]|nr:KN57gp_099 [Dikerogammarus haemobaphes nudivirus]
MDIINDLDIYRKYALLDFIRKDKVASEYLNNISGDKLDEEILQKFYRVHQTLQSKIIMIKLGKGFVKHSFMFAKSKFIGKFPLLKFITPENIPINLTDEEYLALISSIQNQSPSALSSNLYFIIGKNILIGLLNIDLEHFIDSLDGGGLSKKQLDILTENLMKQKSSSDSINTNNTNKENNDEEREQQDETFVEIPIIESSSYNSFREDVFNKNNDTKRSLDIDMSDDDADEDDQDEDTEYVGEIINQTNFKAITTSNEEDKNQIDEEFSSSENLSSSLDDNDKVVIEEEKQDLLSKLIEKNNNVVIDDILSEKTNNKQKKTHKRIRFNDEKSTESNKTTDITSLFNEPMFNTTTENIESSKLYENIANKQHEPTTDANLQELISQLRNDFEEPETKINKEQEQETMELKQQDERKTLDEILQMVNRKKNKSIGKNNVLKKDVVFEFE